jgi:copper chaperone
MTEITFTIEGMSCQHCVMRVKKSIDALPGIVKSDVSLGSAIVSFDESKVKKEEIAASVEKAGYKIVSR